MKYLALAIALCLTASNLQAAPPAFEATYAVNTSGVTLGEMTSDLSYTDNGYTYQKITKANGLAALLSGDTLTERSSGQKKGDQLTPQNYLQRHQNKRKDKSDEVHFTADGTVEGKYAGNAYHLDAPQGTLDLALMELHLMDDMAAGSPLDYHIVSKGKLQDYHFRKLGKETLEVPAGSYECEKVGVVHTDGERQTTLWLAPSLNYAIVQVRHKEDGDVIETRLTRYTPR
jgi:hypothetical protein